MVARVSECASQRSDSLIIMFPRSVGEMSRHAGLFIAARAAATAVSTSSAVAAYTEAISVSSLFNSSISISSYIHGAVGLRGVDSSQLLAVAALDPFVVDEQP